MQSLLKAVVLVQDNMQFKRKFFLYFMYWEDKGHKHSYIRLQDHFIQWDIFSVNGLLLE